MEFKSTTILCKGCGRLIMVRKVNVEQGFVQCNHKGCTARNALTSIHYEETILNGLPGFGDLVYKQHPALRYPLQTGLNVIGTSATASICLDRTQFIHDGLCHISRRHCTIEVSFDPIKGILCYALQDGAKHPDKEQYELSLNGTSLNGYTLRNGEVVLVPENALIGLGGADTFQIIPYLIPADMLATYKRTQFDPNTTE